MDDAAVRDSVPTAAAVEEAPTLYERDFYLWCYKQADLLRLQRFSQADLPNVIEELETLGRSLRTSLRTSYRLVVIHLLKWQVQPEKRTTSWEVTIVRERHHIDDIEQDNPTLREQAASLVEEAYPKARRSAARETGLPLSAFPAECPYTLDRLRDDEWMPEDGAGTPDADSEPSRPTLKPTKRKAP